jgi:hypothetical protein
LAFCLQKIAAAMLAPLGLDANALLFGSSDAMNLFSDKKEDTV